MEATWEGLRRDWIRSLRARNLSDQTLRAYDTSARQMIAYLSKNDLLVEPEQLHRRQVEAFITDVRERTSAATASVRFRAILEVVGPHQAGGVADREEDVTYESQGSMSRLAPDTSTQHGRDPPSQLGGHGPRRSIDPRRTEGQQQLQVLVVRHAERRDEKGLELSDGPPKDVASLVTVRR
jgi:hypothetical protein